LLHSWDGMGRHGPGAYLSQDGGHIRAALQGVPLLQPWVQEGGDQGCDAEEMHLCIYIYDFFFIFYAFIFKVFGFYPIRVPRVWCCNSKCIQAWFL
jgi:hypothetical protein